MCEQMGIEPKDDDIPIDLDDFCEETQLAFHLYKFLPDRWEGMSATYLGKDMTVLPFLFDTYQIKNKNLKIYVMNILQHIDLYVGNDIRKKQKAKSKGTK